MKKITIFLLISATILTLVAVAMIPQIMVPDDDGSGFLVKESVHKNKEATPAGAVAVQSGTECGLSVYGLDCKIAQYLENNLMQTSKNGQKLCSYEKFADFQTDSLAIYLYYSCGEFYAGNDKIYVGSSGSGPVALMPAGDSYDVLNVNFPDEISSEIQNVDVLQQEKLAQINRERARNFFHADFNYRVEKTTAAACAHDFDCATPGEYLAQNRCPFTSTCLQGKCAVICPDFTGLGQ
jgi:hypothetical protein